MNTVTTLILRAAPISPGVWVGAPPPPPVRVQVPLGEPDWPLVVLLLGVVVGAPRRKVRPVVENGIIIWRTLHGTIWTGRCMKERRSKHWFHQDIEMLSTYEHRGIADGNEALDVLGVGFDVEPEERRGVAAECSDLEGRLLVDEVVAAETEQEGQNRVVIKQASIVLTDAELSRRRGRG